MSIFDRFKKIQPEEPAAPKKTETIHPGEIAAKYSEHEILEYVKEKSPDTLWEGDKRLLFRENGLHLSVAFGEMQPAKGLFCVQLLFISQHPYFDEDLVESCAGIGRTPDEAALNAAEGFCTGVLPMMMAAFKCEGETGEISTELDGEVHTFRVPCFHAVQHMGDKEIPALDLWEIVKDEMPDYLGKKRVYAIKLFATCNGKKPVCEARINGTVYPDLSDVLFRAVLKQKKTEKFASDKVFMLLIQSPRTFTHCPFTKQQVGELTWKAIDAMQEIRDEASHDRIFQEIRAMAGDPSLGEEICCFTPEIYARLVVQYRDADALLAVKGTGKQEIRLRKSQLSSYGYIEDAVFQYLRKRQPDKEQNLRIMGLSAQFKSLNQAILDGSKIEDMRFSALAYSVGEDYQIR